MAIKREEIKSVEKDFTECEFTKEQLCVSKKYFDKADLVNILVGDKEGCTLNEVDRRIEEFKKGKVN